MEIHAANVVNKIAELFKVFITDGHVSLLGRHCMYSAGYQSCAAVGVFVYSQTSDIATGSMIRATRPSPRMVEPAMPGMFAR